MVANIIAHLDEFIQFVLVFAHTDPQRLQITLCKCESFSCYYWYYNWYWYYNYYYYYYLD